MKHLLFAAFMVLGALAGLLACVTKPVYNVEVLVAEGATLNSTITSTKPMDVKTDAAINIPVSAIPDI